MSNNDSFTCIDQLATETILDIFEYLSSNDILYTFFDLNERFNSILLNYQRYSNTLISPTTNFYVWQNIISIIRSRIQQLVITTDEFYFSLDLFPNLKSLVISSTVSIDDSLFYSIFKSKQFNQLKSLKIQGEIHHKNGNEKYLQNDLYKHVFHNQIPLETFECLSSFDSYDYAMIHSWQINENIRSLSLRINACSSVFSLLAYTPNLKSFKLITKSSLHRYIRNDQLDLPKTSLEKFDFTCEPYRSTFYLDDDWFENLTFFIKEFSSSLICLSLNFSAECNSQTELVFLNGILLREELLKPMIKLKTFSLYAKFNPVSFETKNILATFKDQYWFDQNWSIGIHDQYIYTLPFHFDKLDGFIDFDHIQSSNPMIINSSQLWRHVISINFVESYVLNLNLIKQLKVNMPNLRTITFTSFAYNRLDTMKNIDINEDEIIQTNATLDSVTTVYLRGSFIEDFQKWLIHVLPNLKHLVLPVTYSLIPVIYNKIESLRIRNLIFLYWWKKSGDIYFPNIKLVVIELFRYDLNDLMKILITPSNCKILILHLSLDQYRYKNTTEIDLYNMFGGLGLIEILKNYHVQYGYNYLKFTRKDKE